MANPIPTVDITIIGAGGAGLSAAIEAVKLGADVRVLTRGSLLDGKTANAQGGVQASVGKDDSPESHFEDTMKAGNNKSNPDLARMLAYKARETVTWLEACGVEFDRDGEEYLISKAAGLSRPRILSCGDTAGKGIVAAVSKTAFDCGVKIEQQSAVISVEKNECGFLTNFFNTDEPEITQQLQSTAIIIATGGAMSEEKKAGLATERRLPDVPDGLWIAQKLGAKIVSPELEQFHPTGVVMPKALRRKRIPEVMRGDGAKLLNRDGEEFADSLLTRNQLSARIVTECQNGRGVETEDGRIGVWLDTPLVEQLNGTGYIAQRYPTFYKLFLDQGHDLAKDRVLVYPIVHYSLGGIEIDVDAMTATAGLFAAGEVTWGVHGEDRLMGNSLLDIFVFGRVAGKAASKYVMELTENNA